MEKFKTTDDALLQRAHAALKVLTLTRGTRAYLLENDPKGLEQAEEVIADMAYKRVPANPRP